MSKFHYHIDPVHAPEGESGFHAPGTLTLESYHSGDRHAEADSHTIGDGEPDSAAATSSGEIPSAIMTLLSAHSFAEEEVEDFKSYVLTDETYQGSLFQLNKINYELAEFINKLSNDLLSSLKKDPQSIKVTFGLLSENPTITEASAKDIMHAIKIEYIIRTGYSGVPSGAFAPKLISPETTTTKNQSKICSIQ